MKKLFSAILLCVCTLCFGIVLTACGEAKPVEISIKKNSVETVVEVNKPYDYSTLVVVVKCDDNSTKEVKKNNEMEIIEIDVTTVGTKTLTVKYLEFTASIEVEVVDDIETVYTVSGFQKPLSISAYQTTIAEEESKYSFKDTTRSYKVGDDNPFIFKPIITAITSAHKVVTLNYIPCTLTLERKNGDTFESVADLTSVVTFDNATFGLDFSESAVGNIYKITISSTKTPSFTTNAIVEVVDGYNVHNEKELSVLNNNANTASIWSEFKTANNIPQDINTNAVILHSSLKITMSDIPSGYIYGESDGVLNGSLKDRKSIYSRNTAENESFVLYGNYFTIDASEVELVNMEELRKLDPSHDATGHSALISFGGDNNDHPTNKQGNNRVDSLKLIGNANRSENTKNAGGLLMILNSSENFVVDNTVAMSFLTNLVTHNNNDNWENNTTISNSKWYDSFSIMAYYYGQKNNQIIDSILVGSGGPVLNLVHVDPSSNVTTRYSDMVIKNSQVETWVNGHEAWFAYNEATLIATNLFALNELFTQTSEAAKTAGIISKGKSFQKDGKVNFIGLISANDPLGNPVGIKGEIIVKDSADSIIMTYSMNNNAVLNNIIDNLKKVIADNVNNLPFFATNNSVQTVTLDGQTPNGIGMITTPIFNPSLDYTASENADAKQAIIDFFSGDYMGIYTSGALTMGAFVQYFDV